MVLSAEEKKTIVKDAMNAILYEHNEAATRAAFSDNFIQHNPMSADGIDHLVAMTQFTFVWEHARWIVDGDIVAYHGLYSSSNPLAPESPLLCVDMWRLDPDNNKIVEHWDALEIHTMGTLASLLAGNAENGLEQGSGIAKNKEVATDFVQSLGDVEKLQTMIATDFVHHSASGVQTVMAAAFATAKEEVEVKKVVASGDLVLVHSHYKTTKKATFDWFRFGTDNKITEHWIVQQDIAEETENPHTHF